MPSNNATQPYADIVDDVVVNVFMWDGVAPYVVSGHHDFVPLPYTTVDKVRRYYGEIGWEQYEPGKIRPPQPSPDCVWDGEVWVCPEPEHDEED